MFSSILFFSVEYIITMHEEPSSGIPLEGTLFEAIIYYYSSSYDIAVLKT